MEKKRLIKGFLAVCAAGCSTVALFVNVEYTGNLSKALNGDAVPQLIAFVVLLTLYTKIVFETAPVSEMTLREKTGYFLMAVLFAVFMVIGKKQSAESDLKYYLLAPLLFSGYVPLFFMLLCVIGKRCTELSDKGADLCPGKVTNWLFEKHIFPGVMGVVFLCRLPYLVAFFPGVMTWDGGVQISSFYGMEPLTNHHPPLLSFFYGIIAEYSQKWEIPNIGMFVIPLLQTILSAYAVAKVFELFRYLKAPYWLRWTSLIYYAAFTVWCIFDTTVIKDTLYYPLTMLFTIQIIYGMMQKEEYFGKKRNLLRLLVVAVLMTQVRNNGIFVLLFTMFAAFFVIPKRRKALFAGTAFLAIFIIFVLQNVLYPRLGVINLAVKEDTYCIMYQQTAKYGQDYPDDVTQQEREFLDTLFDYDELVNAYNPNLADWVKNCLRISEANSPDHTNREFAEIKQEYFKVWFAQFKRHPLSYINTFFECSYGWYYPEAKPYKEGVGFYESDRNTFTNGMHASRQSQKLAPARFVLEQLSKAEYLPGLGLLYRCGFYTWCVLLAAGCLLIQKRYRDAVAAVPALVNILVCMISPVNTCIRYALPTMCMIPIIYAVIFKNTVQRRKDCDKGE